MAIYVASQLVNDMDDCVMYCSVTTYVGINILEMFAKKLLIYS